MLLYEQIENTMVECRKRLITVMAEENGITIEEATKIADEISNDSTVILVPNLPFKVEE